MGEDYGDPKEMMEVQDSHVELAAEINEVAMQDEVLSKVLAEAQVDAEVLAEVLEDAEVLVEALGDAEVLAGTLEDTEVLGDCMVMGEELRSDSLLDKT